MQTASVVDPGHLRVGGQLSGAPYCGSLNGGLVGYLDCNAFPDGFPVPELRVDGRYGVARRFDVGLSMQGYAQVQAPERAFQLGLTADLKGELLRVPTAGPTHVLSLGFLGAAAIAGRLAQPLWSQFELGVPAFYGLQFSHLELVLSATVSQRFSRSPSVSPSPTTAWVNFSVGLYRRDPAGFGLQLSYLTEAASFSMGALQLQGGWFFDLL